MVLTQVDLQIGHPPSMPFICNEGQRPQCARCVGERRFDRDRDDRSRAAGEGAQDILLTTRADNQAVLPLVLAAGLRGRIRMSADVLTVRIPVRELRPLPRA